MVNGVWGSAVVGRRYRIGKISRENPSTSGSGSMSRNGTSNTQHRTPNDGKKKPLRGGAAEGTGERRSDVGGDDDLFGRFLRLHLFAAARGDPGRRI